MILAILNKGCLSGSPFNCCFGNKKILFDKQIKICFNIHKKNIGRVISRLV